jgi:hypothetical protein
MKKIAVIGGGWYGCHIARVLKLAGHDITLFESRDDIFKGISGNFGIRLHTGPHYPRSEKTRKSCREGYAEFIKTYPDLIVEHAYSIYGLGELDANNEPPKVDIKTFRAVGNEIKNSREIDPKKWGYNNLQNAFNIEEPSILLGESLREKFKTYLQSAGVKLICNFNVHKLIKLKDSKTIVMGDSSSEIFDYVVNTTSYHALLPPPEPSLPFELDIVYQPCLALVYEDRLSEVISLPPFSFIVMDGWFPCMMPYITDKEEIGSTYRKYIVTHGKYTIMGSYKTVEDASDCLAKINEKFVVEHVQPKCKAEMERFWPLFGIHMPNSTERRFKYVGWKGAVLAKLKTNREFRSAVTFARDGVAYIIPGKVSNIFDAARETLSLIDNHNVLQQGVYQYVKNGTLDDAASEITEAIDPKIRNTCNLQTYAEITDNFDKEEKPISPESIQSSLSKSKSLSQLPSKDIKQTPGLKSSDSVLFFQSPPKTPSSITETNGHKPQIKSKL